MDKKISLLKLLECLENERQHFPLLDVFQKFKATDYSGTMKYTMTSPESIRHWSFGEVKYAESINIKTKEP